MNDAQLQAANIDKAMKAGAELMRGFVIDILRRNLSPAEALRIAELVMQIEI